MTELASWREVAIPRPDIADGSFDEANRQYQVGEKGLFCRKTR